jgi:hypothetical protein
VTFVLAVTDGQKTFWYVALGLGLVVVLVVIAVLTLLRGLVRDIDKGVDTLWMTTKRLAQNTTGLYQFAGTASIALALRDELIRHDKMLSQL